MGSSSSKPHSASSTSSSSVHRAHRVFHSSCLRPPSGSHHSDSDNDSDDHPNKENGCNGPCTDQNETESDQLKSGCFRKVKVEQPDEMPSISSNVGLQEWDQANFTRTSSRAGSSSTRASSTQSLNPSSRFLSRFSLIPGNISFRLSRASSLGSSRAYPVSSSSITSNNNSANRRLDPPSSVFSDNMRDNPTITTHDVNLHSTSGHAEIESMETRLADRRIGPREPVERNVRFSRTLSVGRLRDRVLRRSSFSDLTFCPLRREREARDMSQGSERQVLDNETRAPATDRNVATSPTSSGYPLDARYHDLLEHRSNFLERRRRIRSQVRALQRLGSRFENLSGHERSCISSGQHRTGRCTCRVNTRDANSNDDTSARASISRIVMLAEALFEVLDEIHQQSVVLSSRPSVSSIGSVPAPNEVVESLPLKLYDKSQKHQNDEAAQCYICLVEYEEGDNMRVLPCHHEFHRTCVDKWLKEIHRVCPLCRGDICRSGSLLAEN
ncbi:unnamed protein product, partial [Vitis vinifera]